MYKDLSNILNQYKSDDFKLFQERLIKTVYEIIGVKTPELKKIAKEIGNDYEFMNNLPHTYFEENQVHAFILSDLKDFNEAIVLVDKFLNFVDNWATCDQLCPKIFKKNKESLLPYIDRWIKSYHPYKIRFAIKCLMSYYLDDDYDIKYLNKVISINNDEYYVNMMIAWYLSVALVKRWDDAIKVIEAKELDKWIHNKAIQKALESFRISDEKKEYLKTLKL